MTAEVQWSELQRDPRGVAALADRGPVRVRRRDGVAFLIIPEDQALAAGEGAATASRALRNAVAHLGPAAADEVLDAEFPWVDVLPETDRAAFLAEFVRAVGVSAELGNWSPLATVIRGWKATAAVYADPVLLAGLRKPVDGDLGPVPAPAAG